MGRWPYSQYVAGASQLAPAEQSLSVLTSQAAPAYTPAPPGFNGYSYNGYCSNGYGAHGGYGTNPCSGSGSFVPPHGVGYTGGGSFSPTSGCGANSPYSAYGSWTGNPYPSQVG